jgi:glycosyltransferase involved in cell wall biosynthesis
VTGARPELSVVVMGYRDEDSILAAVRSVLDQVGDERVEVVVVTSGGDASAALVQQAFPGLPVIESAERLLPGGARNAGVAATSGEVVAFLAADCRAEPGWVAGRLRAHRAGHDVVASAVVPREPRTAAAWASHLLLFPARLPGRRAAELPPFDDGGHGLSLRRSLLEQLGPFDEQVRIGEDTFVLRNLARTGTAIWFEPSVANDHPAPSTLAGLLRDSARRGALRGRWWDDHPARTGRAALVVTCMVRVWQRLHWTWRKVARSSPSHLPTLARVLPWVAAGAVVGQVAWAREVRAGPSGVEAQRRRSRRNGRSIPS